MSNSDLPRQAMPTRDPAARARDFGEVATGYDRETALREASRCLRCARPRCVEGCPVRVDIPRFIAALREEGEARAFEVLARQTSLPAVCGRVCPQETQCERSCVRGARGEAVAIGNLERYVADCHREEEKRKRQGAGASASQNSTDEERRGRDSGCGGCGALPTTQNRDSSEACGGEASPASPRSPLEDSALWGHCGGMAVVGSGPAGLSCAGELAARGHRVTVFEALHLPGGVLRYGIPAFRLPKDILEEELAALRARGVSFLCNAIIGKTYTLGELRQEYDAVFLGCGAGLPRFMDIPGEGLVGVYSANEFLTRVNLMGAYRPGAATPVEVGERTFVVGGGNVAMDAARTALRLGAREVTVLYRRSERELPARREEVRHAREEGVAFRFLCAPTRIVGYECESDPRDKRAGRVAAVECAAMTLGEPDERGRRSPRVLPGGEFTLAADTVIMAIGTSPNPLLAAESAGLATSSRGGIVADERGGTSLPGVFAGGDAVTGSATVISAMGAGKRAAAAMDEWARNVSRQGGA